jgi:hypothetical protein
LERESEVPKRIAIIEDEAAIRDNYSAAFRREGYAVEGFDAREPALNAFERTMLKAALSYAVSCEPVRPTCPSSFSRHEIANLTRYPGCDWAPTIT